MFLLSRELHGIDCVSHFGCINSSISGSIPHILLKNRKKLGLGPLMKFMGVANNVKSLDVDIFPISR